jgi:type IV pilus assembly protein PilA
MRQQKGFTLIKLLVVITIIAILASLAIPQNLSYQRKSKASSYAQRKSKVSFYAERIAMRCLLDLAEYCIDNPGSNATGYTVGDSSYGINCRNTSVATAGGTVNLTALGAASCGPDGTLTFGGPNPTDGGIIATLSGITDFRARCFATNSSIRCTVEKVP